MSPFCDRQDPVNARISSGGWVRVSVLVWLLVACGRGSMAPERLRANPDKVSTTEAVAVQLADLPAGFHQCPYSGDMDALLANIRSINPQTFQSSSATWERLKGAGATEGYAAYYGDNDMACDNLIKPRDQRQFGDEEEHIRNHPRMVFSFVIRFPDAAAAAAAFRADYFGQSQLKQQVAFDTVEGEATRLGVNSVTSSSQGSPIQIRQAVWQKGAFNVFFGSTAIEVRESEIATKAMDARIR